MFNQPQQVQSQTSNEVKFHADAETIQILQNIYPELINSMINLAIKKFTKDNLFKEYFLRQEFRDSIDIESEPEEVQINSAPQAPQSTAQQTTSQSSGPSPISVNW